VFLLVTIACNRNNKSVPIESYSEISKQVIDSLIKESESFYNNNILPIEFDTYLKEAVEVARNSDNNMQLFELYILVAQRYRKASKFSKSLEVLQEALNIANVQNDDYLRAKAVHNMAVNFRRLNDNAQALKYHVQALELAENVNDTFLIHCSFNGMGNVYFHYKDYARAILYFHNSLQFLGKKEPNILGEAINANLLGESWLYQGNTDSAMYYLEQSFVANEKIGSELGKGICHNGMGLVYHQMQDYQKAVIEFKKALQIYENLNMTFYKAMSLNDLGSTYMAMGEYQLAQRALTGTFAIASQIGSKRFALDASTSLAKLYNMLGDSELSFEFSTKSMAYKDSITEELQVQNTEAMNVLYKAEKQEREIVILKQNAELAALKMGRQRLFFIAVGGAVAIILIVLFLIIRQRQLKSKINEIGLEQKLLRAQLNPHFVFNSLSAVQNFILKNDKKVASEYLVNFSRLMRNILMGSGSDFITLENELEILDDYLKLQQLRFQGKFDYYFEVSNTIETEYCMVPPMLIQPFVENSIEHGIRNIADQGIITISFNKYENQLIIEVEDNGRGIQDQQETEKEKGHISMATKITKQRLLNLQAITKQNCTFRVIDNKTENNLPGVLVRLIIPYKEEE